MQPLAADHRVVTFDARGNGERTSPPTPQTSRWNSWFDDVLAVADTCNAVTFHHLGFSLGAKVGWGVRGGG